MKAGNASTLVLAILLASPVMAADDLGIAMDAVPKAITEAAARVGASIDFNGFNCSAGDENCRWDSGTGVDLFAQRGSGANADQLEAGWNNGRSTSNSQSGSLYRGLCASIVAAARPQWSRQQVTKMVDQIALTKITKADADVDKKAPGLSFYGSRAIPSMPDFPAEAYVQCGARALP